MKELRLKLWDPVKEIMFKPQAMSFDAKTTVPFAVKGSGQMWEPADNFIILQWVGLSDSQGTNVFEGDIVEISSTLYKIEWISESAGYVLVEESNSVKRDIADVLTGTVSGNIYENPKLLKK